MPDDEGLFHHEVAPWTVGQMRKAMDGVPDGLPLTVITTEGDEQIVTSAGPWAHAEGTADSVRARITAGELKADHFEIGLEWPGE